MDRIEDGKCPVQAKCAWCGKMIEMGDLIAQYDDHPALLYRHADCADEEERLYAQAALADQAALEQAEATGLPLQLVHDPEAERILDMVDRRRRHELN